MSQSTHRSTAKPLHHCTCIQALRAVSCQAAQLWPMVEVCWRMVKAWRGGILRGKRRGLSSSVGHTLLAYKSWPHYPAHTCRIWDALKMRPNTQSCSDPSPPTHLLHLGMNSLQPGSSAPACGIPAQRISALWFRPSTQSRQRDERGRGQAPLLSFYRGRGQAPALSSHSTTTLTRLLQSRSCPLQQLSSVSGPPSRHRLTQAPVLLVFRCRKVSPTGPYLYAGMLLSMAANQSEFYI